MVLHKGFISLSITISVRHLFSADGWGSLHSLQSTKSEKYAVCGANIVIIHHKQYHKWLADLPEENYVRPMHASRHKFIPCCWPLTTTPVDQAIKGHLILQTATRSLSTETCMVLPTSVRWDILTQKYLCVSLRSCLRSRSVNNCSIKLAWRDIIQFSSASSYPLSKLWLANIHKISHVC